MSRDLLTEQDVMIAKLVSEGMTNAEIAELIGSPKNTVKGQMSRMYDKLGIWSRLELALWYVSRRKT